MTTSLANGTMKLAPAEMVIDIYLAVSGYLILRTVFAGNVVEQRLEIFQFLEIA